MRDAVVPLLGQSGAELGGGRFERRTLAGSDAGCAQHEGHPLHGEEGGAELQAGAIREGVRACSEAGLADHDTELGLHVAYRQRTEALARYHQLSMRARQGLVGGDADVHVLSAYHIGDPTVFEWLGGRKEDRDGRGCALCVRVLWPAGEEPHGEGC